MQNSLCELLGIKFPIIQAGMGVFTSAEMVIGASNFGALGSLGSGARNVDDLKVQLDQIVSSTNHPFAVNHILTSFNETAFKITLDFNPTLISLSNGDPGDLVQSSRCRDTSYASSNYSKAGDSGSQTGCGYYQCSGK